MNGDGLIAEVELGGGRLSLYQGRLVHGSDAATETIPLAQLASVRTGFEREAGKLGGAIALGIVAGLLLLIATPLRAWLAATAAQISDPDRRESLDAVLHSVFSAFAAVAGALPALAAALLAVLTHSR